LCAAAQDKNAVVIAGADDRLERPGKRFAIILVARGRLEATDPRRRRWRGRVAGRKRLVGIGAGEAANSLESLIAHGSGLDRPAEFLVGCFTPWLLIGIWTREIDPKRSPDRAGKFQIFSAFEAAVRAPEERARKVGRVQIRICK
jgi:hypothetical protein